MGCYIIVVADSKGAGEDLTAQEIFDMLIPLKVWDFREDAAGIKNLKAGDKVVFYLGGLKARYFAGAAILASDIYVKRKGNPDPLRAKGKDYFTRRAELKEVKVWEKPVPIKPLIPKLGFIKNKDRYGVYMRRTAISIPEEDYRGILEAAGK